MNKREELEQLSEEHARLDNIIADHYVKIEPISKRRAEIACQIVIEERLLEGTKWTLSDYSTVTLSVDGDPKQQPNLQAAMDLVSNNFFGEVKLAPGVEMEFSYDNLELHFEDPKLVTPIVKELGLVVDPSNIVKKLRALKRDVAGLESLCHLLNIKA